MYSRGESTQPWGEPVEETRLSERQPFTFTHCVLLVKKSIIQLTRLLSRLNSDSSLLTKTCGWIVLKAEEKSEKQKPGVCAQTI